MKVGLRFLLHLLSLLFYLRFWAEIYAALNLSLLLFYFERTLEHKHVRADAGHLPGYFYLCRVGLYRKAIVANLTGDNCLSEPAYDSELIAEIAVDRLKPLGQRDNSN